MLLVCQKKKKKKAHFFFLKEAFLPLLEPYLVRRLCFGISTNREPYDVAHIWGPVKKWIVFLFRRLNKIRITQKAILILQNSSKEITPFVN